MPSFKSSRVHQEDDVPTMINILHASNPTRESPVGVYVLELVELVGGAMPLLINHRLDKMTFSNTRTNRILRALHQYEIRNQGVVTMHCFTSIAPFSTIHEDICSLALEKIASLVIIPFHQVDGPAVRTMQREVLERAPCSVGILVNRGMLKASRTMSESWFTLHVCVIFLGGPDDREALAYGSRMAEHPNIMVTVIRIIDVEHEPYDLLEATQDLNAASHFKIIHMDNNRAVYKEEGVTEGLGTAEVLQSLNEGFDLMLVGRRHDDNSPIIVGLSEWCEIRELGIIGDMLISSDFKSTASVLVVQQNASVVEGRTQVSIHMSTHNSQLNNSRIARRI